jgi:hypothetical protein
MGTADSKDGEVGTVERTPGAHGGSDAVVVGGGCCSQNASDRSPGAERRPLEQILSGTQRSQSARQLKAVWAGGTRVA